MFPGADMQKIVIAEPYEFVPPRADRVWPQVLWPLVWGQLDVMHGIQAVEGVNVERLQDSQRKGHGIILASNHCRNSDPPAMLMLGHFARTWSYSMASWHLFKQTWAQTFVLRRFGGFSLNREGVDRASFNAAIDIVTEAQRPLVIFPEGVVTRTNDRLAPFMDGLELLARTSAKKRAALSPPGKVVIHPVAIRYFYGGNPERTLTPYLVKLERSLNLPPDSAMPVKERICRVGLTLLEAKEKEHLGAVQSGELKTRLDALINGLLGPLEAHHGIKQQDVDTFTRIRRLRSTIVPQLASPGEVPVDRTLFWKHLEHIYLAQQVACYPPDYLDGTPSPERLLETVERFEEDLTDHARVYRPLHCIIQVGEALEVPEQRDRSGPSLMQQVRTQVENMLTRPETTRPGFGKTPPTRLATPLWRRHQRPQSVL